MVLQRLFMLAPNVRGNLLESEKADLRRTLVWTACQVRWIFFCILVIPNQLIRAELNSKSTYFCLILTILHRLWKIWDELMNFDATLTGLHQKSVGVTHHQEKIQLHLLMIVHQSCNKLNCKINIFMIGSAQITTVSKIKYDLVLRNKFHNKFIQKSAENVTNF